MVHRSIPGWLRQFLRLPEAPAADDAVFLERFVAGGDEEAFAAILGRHGPLVWGVCRRILADLHEAEDAFQATFLLLLSRAGAIRRPSSLAAWLHGVACRLACRLKQRRRPSPGPSDPPLAVDPAAGLAWQEMLALLDEELQRLPAVYRLPLVLCYLQGLTRDEAARQLGWSLATVRRRVDRGRELLRAHLLRRGVTLSGVLVGSLLVEAVRVPAALQAATLAAVGHWLAGPAEHGLIAASVRSIVRWGGSSMASASLRTILLLGTAALGLGVGIWAYCTGRQGSGTPPDDPPVPVAKVDAKATDQAETARQAEEAFAACEPREFQLLCQLAALQARRGDVVAARKLFGEVAHRCGGGSPERTGGLLFLAHYLGDAGDVKAAQAILEQGQQGVRDIRADNKRNDLLRLAAVITVEKIDRNRGLREVEALPERERLSALSTVAVLQAEAGDVAGAVRTLDRVKSPYLWGKIHPSQIIAEAQLKAGDREGAQQTLRQALAGVAQMREMKVGGWQERQAKILGRFATVQHRVGDSAGAGETHSQLEKAVEEAGPKNFVCLAELARTQAETGRREAAVRTLERFRKAAEPHEDREVTWAGILPTQQALGDFQGMADTLKRVPYPESWKEACAALAGTGQVNEARVLARAAPSPRIKAWALVGVLQGQLDQVPVERRPRYDGSLSVTVPDTEPPTPSTPTPTPEADYHQVETAYEKAWAAFNKEVAQVRDEAERRRLREEKRPREEAFSVPMLRIAQRHPGEPAAFQALLWILEFARNTAEAETALSLLRQEHLAAKKLGEACNFARLSRHKTLAEQLLRTALEKSPHRFVRRDACEALAEFLHDQARLIEALGQGKTPETARAYEQSFGAAELQRLKALDPAVVLREAETYYRRVLDEFADIHPPRATRPLADRAREALDEIHLLAVGQTASDIEGEDVDGKPLRLSEHRGKVVVLVFWATWCAPCRAMIPSEKALVKRSEGRPFVLLGVNGDPERGPLREWLTKNPLPWRSWRDGRADAEKGGGRIARAWNVTGWPTVYVLDPRGVIRYRNPTGKDLDSAVDTLLKEAEKGPARP